MGGPKAQVPSNSPSEADEDQQDQGEEYDGDDILADDDDDNPDNDIDSTEEEEDEEDERDTGRGMAGADEDGDGVGDGVDGGDDEGDETLVPENTPVPRRRKGRPPRAIVSSDEDKGAGGTSTPTTKRARRGRPPKPKGVQTTAAVIPTDAFGHEMQVIDDEIQLNKTDPFGEQKVTQTGYLNDGREYRCRVFTVAGRGQRLYMLSTEPARCMNYRDSYLFFLKHKSLYKVIVDDDEKYDLIQRNIIPHSYKGRSIGICTARSVFREFGARIIIAGKRITDDYWEQEYRDKGFVEGEPADPDDKLPPPGMEYNKNQYVAWHGASSVYHQQPVLDVKRVGKRKALITDENWIFEHASAAMRYNTDLALSRKANLYGIYEPHTNLNFIPSGTQSESVTWERIEDEKDDLYDHKVKRTKRKAGLVIETCMRIRETEGYGVHLLDVDEAFYTEEPEEVKQAIRERQARERQEALDTGRDLPMRLAS